MDYEKKIMNLLLDQYEGSKRFIGENKRSQTFRVKLDKVFPEYIDHSDYDSYKLIQDGVHELLHRGWIIAKSKSKSGDYDYVQLIDDSVESIYSFVKRTPKMTILDAFEKCYQRYENKHKVIDGFINEQRLKRNANKPVKWQTDGVAMVEQIFIAILAMEELQQETYIRDFSAKVFKDSKTFDSIANRCISLLYDFGDYPNKEHILEEMNLVANPTYVQMKGQGIVVLNGQKIDMSQLVSDIALSSGLISQIDYLTLTGEGLLTVENLTTFHNTKSDKYLVLYLGGFHNRIRRHLIRKIYEWNPGKYYQHWGDIDAGGFYILEHLKREIGVPFRALYMDRETLEYYKNQGKPLTENDRNRLTLLLGKGYDEVIGYMLEEGIKLEQEQIAVI